VTAATDLPGLPARESIDAVILDAGGVLIIPDAEHGQSALAAVGCPSEREDWHRAHYAANVLLDEMDEPDWVALRRSIADMLGVRPDQREVADPVVERVVALMPWVPVAGAAQALLALAEGGYRLGIVSNATGVVAQQLEEYGICSVTATGMARVEVVIDSHIVGVEKPDPRIFGFALDALGVDPARCLYIGDTVRFDVRGARGAGLHPVHVDPFAHCQVDDHAHISALADLTSHLLPGPAATGPMPSS
jgi:putative hydrolase of the HAD superfamily